jgi:hypothetical protein
MAGCIVQACPCRQASCVSGRLPSIQATKKECVCRIIAWRCSLLPASDAGILSKAARSQAGAISGGRDRKQHSAGAQ